ncbi:stage V sporulation protein B [Bacillus fonticola]|uniref:stage V sporulation protein B n=1 Tax=Bacillus fonticola TaxID=2728853 RepID=UPI0014734737|nr:stage V sporulation protein B [Bacillus fonticola]
MSKFIQGALILLLAGFVTRILGFINRIVIARVLGDEGVGLYMMAFPTFVLVVTVTQLGLPVAISKSVAEAEAIGDRKKVKKILVVSLATTISLSLVFTPALILLAPILADVLFTDPRTVWPLLAVAPVIPIIAVSSVIRGYFQGKQQMKPAALSQLLEQFVRICLIALLTQAFLPYGVEYAAAAAMVATVLGELVSLGYLLTMFKLKKRFRVRKKFMHSIRSGKKTFSELMRVALPTTGGRMVGSLSWFFEPIVVANSLAIAGVTATMATKQYGELTGYAMPLLMLPSFITHALSTSLVPAISEAYALKQYKLVELRMQQSIRFSLVSGGIAVVIMMVLAGPLVQEMYNSQKGAVFIQVMAPFFLLYFFQGPLTAVLQALDLARAAMINSMIGAFVKLTVITLLASQPTFGIMGAALGIVVGFVLVTFLHFFTVLKHIQFTLHLRDFVKTIVTMALVGWLGKQTFTQLYPLLGNAGTLFITIIVMFVVYITIILRLKLIRHEELAKFPVIGKWFTVG